MAASQSRAAVHAPGHDRLPVGLKAAARTFVMVLERFSDGQTSGGIPQAHAVVSKNRVRKVLPSGLNVT